MFVVFTRVNGKPGARRHRLRAGRAGHAGPRARRQVTTPWAASTCPRCGSTIASCRWKTWCSAKTASRSCCRRSTPSAASIPRSRSGLAEGAFEEAVRYARDRSAFGRPIGDFQGMRWKVADMYIEIEAGRGLLYRACVTADPFPDPLLAAMAKIYCNEMSIRVTSEAIQVLRRLRLHRRVSWCRASIAARATAASAAAPRRRCAI